MNKNSKEIIKYITEKFPNYNGVDESTDDGLKFVIPAPETSDVGSLFILTTEDDDLYFRNSHPYSIYFVDSKEELGEVISKIINDEALWVIGMKDDEWVETTLIASIDDLETEEGVEYQVMSWSGKHDQIISSDN